VVLCGNLVTDCKIEATIAETPAKIASLITSLLDSFKAKVFIIPPFYKVIPFWYTRNPTKIETNITKIAGIVIPAVTIIKVAIK
jgi:hypothetical protein